MLCTLFIMLGECYVFYFYFYFAPRFKICSENVCKPINKKSKAYMENKIKYYKICDIIYGIRFEFHKVLGLKLQCLNIL